MKDKFKLKVYPDKYTIVDKDIWIKYYNQKICLTTGYPSFSVDGKLRMLHRLITEAPKGYDVDHINHNKLDNRRTNLRLVTRTKNNWNSVKRRNSLSNFKGVTKAMCGYRWRARITVNKQVIYLGHFDDEITAYIIYRIAAKKYFGKHACLK